MAIQIGAPVPDVELKVMGEERPESVRTGELFQDKRVVLFALPGAFTPTCSKLHLPGYIELSDQIRANGVEQREPQSLCVVVDDFDSLNDSFMVGRHRVERTCRGAYLALVQ